MTKLRIGPEFALPEDAVTRTFIVYGGKGKGKTNFGGVLCEELAARRDRFCVVDPLDVWWGLQHGTKRGDEGGLDVVIHDRGRITITEAGLRAGVQQTHVDAIAQARDGLEPRQKRILDIVVEAHPEGITREAIAEQMGIHPRGGSFGEDLARLRGRGLVTYDRGGMVRARDFLFARSA